jgi:hypothetical protein
MAYLISRKVICRSSESPEKLLKLFEAETGAYDQLRVVNCNNKNVKNFSMN